MEGPLVNGGVLISHQVHEGKHEYEVQGVIKKTRREGEKFFLRRGDKLWQVNETDVQNMSPEELAQILSQGSPLLTVHKAIKKKKPMDASSSDEDIMYPFSKEEVQLRYSQEMKREESGEDNVLSEEKDEVDFCTEQDEDNLFLVVTMKKTSISVITGRSCDPKEPCFECRNQKCLVNDIVIVTESSTVTLVPRGSGSYHLLKTNEAVVQSYMSSLFLRNRCLQKGAYVSENPEKITIYYYKTKTDVERFPVVLNFTSSNCFLRCCKDGDRVLLQVETCDKEKLKRISKSDPSALSYVFYMKSDLTKNTTFESALHTGWFIQIVRDKEDVNMVKTNGPQEDNYFHVIIMNRVK